MSLPQNKVKRSCIEGETSDMVFLETRVTDEVVPENFMDPVEQNNFHLEKSKNLEKEIKNFQDKHKGATPVEVNPPLIQIQSSVLQPLKMIPPKFNVHLHQLPKGTTCFLLKTLPNKPLLPITSPVKISYKASP